MPLTFRLITPADDPAMAAVIRAVMPEFGADGPGFAIHDPEVDHLTAAYPAPGAAYFVVVDEADRVVGGGGFAQLEGGASGVCELRKMYFLPEVRGTGMGERLLRHCLDGAQRAGYRTMYLETLTGMDAAQKLYKKVGFQPLCAPMGSTGHHGCDRWFAMELDQILSAAIQVDWSMVQSVDVLWDTILGQSKAPDWHGRNLNALRDSWVTGDINYSGPPYAFSFTNCDRIPAPLSEFASGVMEIARMSVEENGGSYSAS